MVYKGFDNTLKNKFFTVKIDLEASEEQWFDKECFFCKYYRSPDGTIILADASPNYFSFIGHRRNVCGRSIKEVYSKRAVLYIESLYTEYGSGNSVFRYVRDSKDGSGLWEVAAICQDGYLRCIGKHINDCEFISENNLGLKNYGDEKKEKYGGTVIACADGKGGFVIESCSSELTEKAPLCCVGADLEAVLKKYMCRINSISIFEKSVRENIPISYYDMTNVKTVFSISGNSMGILRISIMPVNSPDSSKVVINVNSVISEKFIGDEGYDVDSTAAGRLWNIATCVLSKTVRGEIYIDEITAALAGMLSQGEILFDDLCREEFFEEAGSPMSKYTVYGSNNREYSVMVLSGFSDSRKDSVMLTVTPVCRAERSELLTERESEILSLAAAGNSNRYIALTLKISEGTVKKILHNGYSKLGICSRVELVKLFGDKEKNSQ